jgi:hypothetical protein
LLLGNVNYFFFFCLGTNAKRITASEFLHIYRLMRRKNMISATFMLLCHAIFIVHFADLTYIRDRHQGRAALLPCPALSCPAGQKLFFCPVLLPCRATRTGHRAGQGNMFCPGKFCTNFQSQMFFSVKLFDLVYN